MAGWMAGWEKSGRLLRVEPVSLAYVAARDSGSDWAVVRVGLERSAVGPAPRRAVEHEQRSLQQREELEPTAPVRRMRSACTLCVCVSVYVCMYV